MVSTPISLSTVTWRQAFAYMVVIAVALTGLIVVLRSDGLQATDAAASRATRWVAHGPSGRVVLVDGFGGRALASLEVGSTGDDMLVADGRAESYVLDDTTAEVRLIDSADLRLGAPSRPASDER